MLKCYWFKATEMALKKIRYPNFLREIPRMATTLTCPGYSLIFEIFSFARGYGILIKSEMGKPWSVKLFLKPLWTILLFLLFIPTIGSSQSLSGGYLPFLSPLEKEVFYEINRARRDPKGCASHLEKWKPYFDGNLLKFPDEIPIKTKEGWKAVDEAIRFLRSTRAMRPLTLYQGMSLGAKDHVKDLLSSGRIAHTGTDGSQPWDRVSRYGTWKKPIGENIAFGFNRAQLIVMGLIIDDGVLGRGHRKNIFNPLFQAVGVACHEPTTPSKTLCVITFAGGYVEKE